MCGLDCKHRWTTKCNDCLQPDGAGGWMNANFEDAGNRVEVSSVAIGAEGSGDADSRADCSAKY